MRMRGGGVAERAHSALILHSASTHKWNIRWAFNRKIFKNRAASGKIALASRRGFFYVCI